MIEGEMESEFVSILPHFPEVKFAFAYGSGAVQQRGYDYSAAPDKLPMLDIIFVVEDPIQWHVENYERNPHHYTCSFDVHWLVKAIQSPHSSGPALWFNVDVDMSTVGFYGRKMKYGVVSVAHLNKDLQHWQCLYIAGRSHKPINVIKYDGDIMAAIHKNRLFALRTALMLLPNEFCETQLYTTIAGLSYTGDQRMMVGAENPHKVDNLVMSQIDSYRNLYKDTIGNYDIDSWTDKEGTNRFNQDSTNFMHEQGNDYLPTYLQYQISSTHSNQPRSAMKVLANVSSLQRKHIIEKSIKSIVSRAAARQTLVNLACVGIGKGFSYVLAKVLKRLKSSK